MNKNFRRLISLLLALTMALGLLQIPAFAVEAPAEKAMEITAERVPEEDAAAAAAGGNGYNIYRKQGDGSYVKLGNVTGSSASSFTDTGVKGKTGTYTYKIEAYRSQSKSAFHTKSITLK